MATDILNEILQAKEVSELHWGLALGLQTKVGAGGGWGYMTRL